MKSHVMLVGRVLEDLSIRCCVSTTHDLKRVVSRIEKEGESFVTLTLPRLAESLEYGLEWGVLMPDHERGMRDLKELSGSWVSEYPERGIARDQFAGFPVKKGSSLPLFLHGLWSQVFDKETGYLLDNPSSDAIQGIRQVCNLYKKTLNPCSEERAMAAFDRYIECDNEVGRHDQSEEMRALLPAFSRVAMTLFGDVLTQADRDVYEGKVVPKHGPGATADRVKANAKYDYRTWTDRLEELFPAGEFLYPSWSHYPSADGSERNQEPTWLEPGAELPVRVVAVPKTAKTPRIIAIEPVYNQYVQQGIAELLVKRFERHNLLSHFLGFSDQQYNRDLAASASVDRSLATLDLSEASDRVSVLHVWFLLAKVPWLRHGTFACRSQKADVPGHGLVRIQKFASMGSALTFPLEAMVFLTIVFLAVEKELGRRLTRKDLKALKGKVRVYGDDIIIPADMTDPVQEMMEVFGLKINSSKSFVHGKFRESCGGDFYDGIDVGYVKVRRDLPTERGHAQEIVSTVALRNLFYQRGYWKTAAALDEVLAGFIPFPILGPDSPGLGRLSCLPPLGERDCPYLQRPLVKAAVVTMVLPDSSVSGTGALLKYFLKRSDEPTNDREHLERAGRPVAINIKPRWVPIY